MSQTQQLCTFFVADRFFGVDVTRVQEVIRYQEITPVPLASSVIRGLINLRGQIVTALDMRARLGLPPRANGDLPMNVVVRTDDGAVSLLVDEIGDVVEVAETNRESAPETLTSSSRELIAGVCKLKDRLLLVLDPERTIAGSADVRPAL
jgi:purine-binding chemotaxis protein CheW